MYPPMKEFIDTRVMGSPEQLILSSSTIARRYGVQMLRISAPIGSESSSDGSVMPICSLVPARILVPFRQGFLRRMVVVLVVALIEQIGNLDGISRIHFGPGNAQYDEARLLSTGRNNFDGWIIYCGFY